MPADLGRILEVASRAARLAAGLCVEVLRESPGEPDAMDKLGKEPVTVADYGSQALLLRSIREAFPDHAVLAEEGSAHLREQGDPRLLERVEGLVSRALGERVPFDRIAEWIDHTGRDGAAFAWTVDPIDGTKGFVRREQFAIAVGLLRDGVPIAGVLACPNLVLETSPAPTAGGSLFRAARGAGATVEPLAGGSARALRASPVAEPRSVRLLQSVESGHGDPTVVRGVVEELGIRGGEVRMDSQAKYAVLAGAGAEIYLRPRSRPDYREKVWDHAAGVVVVEEAGGRVTDLDGRPLDFTRGRRLEANRGILATNGRMHDPVLQSLRRIEARSR